MTAAPQRVRIAKLQDAQLDGVVAIDLACKQMMHRSGVPASEEPARGLAGIAKLTKVHNVLVAEADGVVAGYVAWRDESPGIAYLEDVAVKPELQRLGVGGQLLAAVRQEAQRLSLPVLLTRCWTKATAARAFLEKAGLAAFPSDPGERAQLWREEQESHGGLAKEGQIVMLQSLL
jgi:N-acetylglutamate synthase-like GNAT family acetyltransferase